MPTLTISEIANEVGLRPSAIRYYEEIGVLEPADRVSGQRRYDRTAVYRLTLIRRAQEAGFSLTEIQELFTGFNKDVPVSARWTALSQRKLAELKEKIEGLQFMQGVLQDMVQNCTCKTLEDCGEGIFVQVSGTNNLGIASCCSPKSGR